MHGGLLLCPVCRHSNSAAFRNSTPEATSTKDTDTLRHALSLSLSNIVVPLRSISPEGGACQSARQAPHLVAYYLDRLPTPSPFAIVKIVSGVAAWGAGAGGGNRPSAQIITKSLNATRSLEL